MKEHPTNTPSPFLVAVGDSHVLVDAANGRLLVLNEEGARFWCAFQDGVGPRTPAEQAFLDTVVCPRPLPLRPGEDDGPQVMASAPLQVAANTSDPNPFSADASW